MFEVMRPEALSAALDLFSKVAQIANGLVAFLIVSRISFLVVKISQGSAYGEVLQDAVVFFVAIALYPMLVKTILGVSSDIAIQIGTIPVPEAQSKIGQFFQRMVSDYPLLMIFSGIGDLLILNIAKAIYTILLSVLIASAPLFILLSTLLNIHGGLKTYFGIFITLSLWPIIWNLIGALANNFNGKFGDSVLASTSFWIVFQAMQLLSPIFTFGLMRSMSLSLGSSTAMKIGRKLWS